MKSAIKIAGIASGTFLLSKVKPEWGQRFLYDSLKKFPGVPAKFSQWLEQKWEIDANANFPIIALDDIHSILKESVPRFYEEIESISHRAWSASIGQVHRVKTKSGLDLAVKIQYPGLAAEIENQIDQLIWLAERSPARRFGFKADDWRKELRLMFGAEVDYMGEANRQQRFVEIFSNSPWVVIPKVYQGWSCATVLVQDFVEGQTLPELVQESSADRTQIATAWAHLLSQMLLRSSLVHGDLQPKNWSWSKAHQKIVLYDFGSCIDWADHKQRLFESLVGNIKSGREASPFDYLVALGFDREKLVPINAQLPALTELLLEPFWNERLLQLKEWHAQSVSQDILGEQSWYFRNAGPPWFLWLMRSLAGAFFSLRELNARVCLAAIFAGEQRSLKEERWQNFKVPSQHDYLTQEKQTRSTFADQAGFLFIHVREGSEDRVSMRFPIHMLQSLEEIMDAELVEKLRQQNLSIKAIKERAYHTGLVKQELFKLEKANKVIRVWIA